MSLPRALVVLLAGAFAGSACAVGIDHEGYSQHDEKRFDAATPVELSLTTFDGALEVHAWDRPEVVVSIDKRGRDRQAVDDIDVVADRSGDHIHLEARRPNGGFVFGFGSSASVKFVANVPRATSLVLHSGDGSITVERVTGSMQLRTGDGNITTTETSGDVVADSGDGAIEIDSTAGKLDVRTGDGSLRLTGTPSIVRAHSGDGSIVLRVSQGAAMTADWDISTGDGSVSIELPNGFDADIDAKPSDGRTRNELTLSDVSGGARDERTLRGRLGAGGHTLRIRTGDGDIRLSGS
jgi:hypothetical protein